MTDKQPEALRLAEILDEGFGYEIGSEAAAELRRLHEVNAELVEALSSISSGAKDCGCWADCGDKAKAALAKATGENNE